MMRYRAAVLAGLMWLGPSVSSAQTSTPAAPTLTVAGFSYERVLAETEQGRAAFARVSAVRDQKSREVEERNRALAARVDAFQRSLATLTPSLRDQQSRDL